jgi:hypothetical protein
MSGVRSGVNGTPTFFINGERHEGSYEYPVLIRALKEAAELRGRPLTPASTPRGVAGSGVAERRSVDGSAKVPPGAPPGNGFPPPSSP